MARRVAWMGYEHNIKWVPHGRNTAVGLAADLHRRAAVPVASYPGVELDREAMKRFGA
ncbi:MAG: hypothetical protein ACRC33_24600 [Gemmataceae bacterium]